ncbi:MAG TPA: N-acetylmuramoyl-L-alanine amidase [Candidatus Acidoferrales bacterium]|nr:N-acetylmuramoyl-L-alanine amidase [Candidatus Acidoferrales bacterium]
MKRFAFLGAHSAARSLALAGTAVALVVCLAFPAKADRKSQAREQFERAVKMRTTLEGYLEKDRSLADYKQTIAAYHKVYLISVTAVEVTPSLVAEAELYEEMGRLFDAKYFQSAINTYNFLQKQYPGSRYRGTALLSIARIDKDDLNNPDDAMAAYKDYLRQFPRSQNASEARAGLKEIANAKIQVADQRSTVAVADQHVEPVAANDPPPETGLRVEPRESDKASALVKDIRTWNSNDSTRIVVTLDDTVKYNAARIASPDRIYFDLSKARVGPKISADPLNVPAGLLKSVRVAPNKPGVVRVVLDVDGAKDYSAFLLSNPYRLVIDVHAQSTASAKNTANPVSAADESAKAADAGAAHPPANVSETVAVNSTAVPAAKPKAEKSAAAPPANAKVTAKPPAESSGLDTARKTATLAPPLEPKPTRDGDRSLTRALGLKISRIVIDPGHGGHDTGTIGPHGLMEKDLCLDVALRLGALIEQKLPGAEVIYTRQDDTFIPLEDRTKIANDAKADLFISIHANSSQDAAARGVETYYLNFATSPESMEVATRENANSQESLHDLQDLIQKIARNEKVEESKELASDIQDNLTQRLQVVSHSEKNRGVKKAPFVVLIGANMPSVLSEISFVSNPNDERLLRKADQRQRIADGLYRGISTYLQSLNSIDNNKQKLVSQNHLPAAHLEPAAVASDGNPK